jgi:L-ascorbate metabolism protein UlaG (beta-lactamase superfamily)
MCKIAWLIAACLLLSGVAIAHEADGTVHYLANEGVMAVHGDNKVVFDPLFNEDFGQYELLPDHMRAALFAGDAPFDGIDAVFISHYHDDHFDPEDMLSFLGNRDDVRLYAPQQAVDAMRALAPDPTDLFERVQSVDLAYGDAPAAFAMPGLRIGAVRIPHAGWPERLADVQNLAWRITFDEGPTVLHLGDADTRDAHFASDAAYWDARRVNVAFPPYWYFMSPSGIDVLERLEPLLAIGIHVPTDVPQAPDGRPQPLREVDLFTTPGEMREIPTGDQVPDPKTRR